MAKPWPKASVEVSSCKSCVAEGWRCVSRWWLIIWYVTLYSILHVNTRNMILQNLYFRDICQVRWLDSDSFSRILPTLVRLSIKYIQIWKKFMSFGLKSLQQAISHLPPKKLDFIVAELRGFICYVLEPLGFVGLKQQLASPNYHFHVIYTVVLFEIIASPAAVSLQDELVMLLVIPLDAVCRP